MRLTPPYGSSKKARSEYYSTFINDNTSDQRNLFKASKYLLNLKDDIQFPSHSDAFELANELFTTEDCRY